MDKISTITVSANGILTSGNISLSLPYASSTGGASTKKKNPYIPKKIVGNSETGITTVYWLDGKETMVTCAPEDNYSIETAYFAALAIKVFGGSKKKFKDVFYPIISRNMFLDGVKLKPVPSGRWEKQKKQEAEKKKAEKKNVLSIRGIRAKV